MRRTGWTIWVFACFAWAGLLGCQTEANRAADSGSNNYRIMTFNIRYGTANDGQNRWTLRREAVFEVIRSFDPDMVGLQEALAFQIDEIRGAIPGYSLVGVGRDDGRDKGEHSCILFRSDRFEATDTGTFWFSDTPEIPGSKTWGNSITRICSWARLVDRLSGKGVYIYNLHLDHISQPSREKSAVLLAERILKRSYPLDPVIVTGDFNVGEDNPVIRYLKGNPGTEAMGKPPLTLEDSFRAIHPSENVVGTFNDFKGTQDGDKIDYILINKGFTVLEADIVRTSKDGRYPSDHFPVTAVLKR